MVTFNHVAPYVRDLEAMRAFYETHFGGVANRQYHNPVTGLRTYFLSFPGSDARLELMSRPGFEESVPAERAGWDARFLHGGLARGSGRPHRRCGQRAAW